MLVFCRGAERTKPETIASEIERLQDGKTFAEVQESVHEAYLRLQELGIFEAISIEIDTADEVMDNLQPLIITNPHSVTDMIVPLEAASQKPAHSIKAAERWPLSLTSQLCCFQVQLCINWLLLILAPKLIQSQLCGRQTL